MTGHLLFEAIDPRAAITVSPHGVKDVIRGHIGFDGLPLSDDLSMQAGRLLGERAARALLAGRDIAPTATAAWTRWSRWRPCRPDERCRRAAPDAGRASRPPATRSASRAWPMRQRVASLLPAWG
jgi:beta-N-acetylhexosaminidase